MRMWGLTLACALAVCGACSVPNGGDPDATPFSPYTLTFTTGDFSVPKGTEMTKCLYTKLPADRDVEVVGYKAHMAAGSHHFNMYYTDPTDAAIAGKPFDTLTDCDNGYKFYLAGSQWQDIQQTIPTGLAIEVPAGSVIVLESHYVNSTDATQTGHVDVELDAGDPAQVVNKVGLYFNVMEKIRVEIGQSVRLYARCPVDNGVHVVLMTSHMHWHGSKFEINEIDDTGASTSRYASTDFSHPTVEELWDQPVTISGSGHQLEWACSYANTTSAVVLGGPSAETDEMCIMAAYYWPKQTDQPYCLADAIATPQ